MTSHPAPPSIALSHLLSHTADMVLGVREGRSLTDLLTRVPANARAGTQALAFDVMRRLGGAQAVRGLVAAKAPPPAVDALLVSAIALLWPPARGERAAYPDHTLVDQAVHAARQRTPAAVAFINAVLRRFVRERDALVASVEHQPVGAFNHPLWWVERLKHDWPEHWQALLHEANRHPPMTLRVNARRSTAAAYVQRLAAQGQAARAIGGQGVVLTQPCPVAQLPGFAEGEVSVQDGAAQRAAPLLLGEGLPAKARVLDACAAPGGKTAHLLELAELDLLALDSDPQRLARVQDTLQRLDLAAGLQTGDARQPAAWWDGRPFDAILLDAPCSASGIVRRHPDIRWLRRPDDIAALARIQAQMLDALWPLLAPGGRLLYATCSVFLAEGRDQIDAFLQRLGAGAARLDPGSPGHLLPLPDNAEAGAAHAHNVADGFFYALIHKP
ncbi:MAG TPA: 16S rRNA (cytosine(967)-C(5))-methyltransferase RsmB [Burkholderiaceae bacterium]